MSTELAQAEQAANEIAEGMVAIVRQADAIGNELVFPRPEVYKQADDAYNGIHKLWKEGEEKRLKFTAPLNEVLRMINVSFKGKLDVLDNAKRRLKRAMDNYATDEMIWKRKEQKRLDDEARKKAEDEQLAKAENLEKAGNNKAAEHVISQPTAVLKPKAVEGATDQAQSFTKTVWVAEVVDRQAFLLAVANTEALDGYVTIEQGALNRMAQATKGQMVIPGVVFREQASVGARR